MKSSQPLNKFLEEANPDLAILITRTRQLRRWTSILRQHLDSELAPHCYLSAINETELTLYVDNAAWATRLRFQVPQLLSVLRQSHSTFSKLQHIKVKVLSDHGNKQVPTEAKPGPTMSRENANGINVLSENIDDPGLQQALQRLARHAH